MENHVGKPFSEIHMEFHGEIYMEFHGKSFPVRESQYKNDFINDTG
jgi:hypothetical protein